MDFDQDGLMDILSGCYSSTEPGEGMAGEFHLLRGKDGGGFEAPVTLKDDEGDSLKITISDDDPNADIERICTRPFAVDLDADGHLDIVSGNFGGHFVVFWGTGKGEVDPVSSDLKGADGEQLHVAHHSDPTFVDWDGDGDLDMLSGSDNGGAEMFPNLGTKTEPSFGAPVQLIEPKGGMEAMMGPMVFGEAHITGPQRSTRVTAADVNGDGKLDLLVGDMASIIKPAEGLTETEAKTKLAEWDDEMEVLMGDYPMIENFEDMDEETENKLDAINVKMSAHYEKRAKIVDERFTGFVWLFTQK